MEKKLYKIEALSGGVVTDSVVVICGTKNELRSAFDSFVSEKEWDEVNITYLCSAKEWYSI